MTTTSPQTIEQLRRFNELNAWFSKLCSKNTELWDLSLEIQESVHGVPKEKAASAAAAEAQAELHKLEGELNMLMNRTMAIITAAALLFAAFAIKLDDTASVFARRSLFGSLFLASVCFIAAIVPLTPPIRRAWRDPFEPREFWTLLTATDFASWVKHCWLCNRRTPVITKYKRAHTIAVPCLIAAAALALCAFVFS